MRVMIPPLTKYWDQVWCAECSGHWARRRTASRINGLKKKTATGSGGANSYKQGRTCRISGKRTGLAGPDG
jgi:hypothetical protein